MALLIIIIFFPFFLSSFCWDVLRFSGAYFVFVRYFWRCKNYGGFSLAFSLLLLLVYLVILSHFLLPKSCLHGLASYCFGGAKQHLIKAFLLGVIRGVILSLRSFRRLFSYLIIWT